MSAVSEAQWGAGTTDLGVGEARRLLAHTHWTVAAIGEHLGFEEPTNFVRFFKARTRESPCVFRARSSR